jgi:hypothetical protein
MSVMRRRRHKSKDKVEAQVDEIRQQIVVVAAFRVRF